MSKQWHILIVLDDEYLKRNIVNSLQIEGYFVRGAASATEAVQMLWAEEYDIVVSDQKMPDSDGFELLQWIRAYRPNTRMVMIGMPGSSAIRTHALENGVVSYLEKPLDLHTLKVELRRLLQQTGFSASLESFDLLDVIQMVTMSHKTIAMVVNTGLEEQGLLGFQGGELVWAEYGFLRGEEAFFALAAHKNGTITHQPWTAQVRPNVTQPLSRLIFQALQYRSKYSEFRQLTGEQAVPSPESLSQILFVEPELSDSTQQEVSGNAQETPIPVPVVSDEAIEWWQESPLKEKSYKLQVEQPEIGSNGVSSSTEIEHHVIHSTNTSEPDIIPAKAHKTSAGQRTDLPSWLIEQPTQFEMPALRSSPLSGSDKNAVTHNGQANSAEKQAKKATQRTDEQSNEEQNDRVSSYRRGSSEWGLVEKPDISQLQSMTSTRRTDDFSAPPVQQKIDYAALTTTLQTLGFSIPGFIATALVRLDGQPIVQVVVDDKDMGGIYDYLSSSMQGVLRALEKGAFGHYEDTIVTSLTHFMLYRLVGSNKDIFQVLIVTRDTDPVECLEMMANMEPALEAAL